MEDEKLKRRIGANIAAWRKRMGLTQAQLAERLNYSDKAVSKWERGESIPDVLTLLQLAKALDTTVDILLADPDALPENSGVVEQTVGKVVEKTLKRKANKNIVLGLTSVLVWFVALFVFVILTMLHVPYGVLAFFYAVPANAIVLLSLRSAWRDFRWNRALISAIVWGSLMSIFMTLLLLLQYNAWMIFLLGIPGQIAICLWFRMFRNPQKEEDNG